MRWLCCLLSVCLALCLGACRQERTAEEILCELASSLSLPAGELYMASAKEGEAHHLPADTVRTLYGDGDGEYLIPRLEDYAILLCAHTFPSEIAVFVCRSLTDKDEVRRMALSRADVLERLFADGDALGSHVCLYEKGRIVILLATDDPQRAYKAAARAMR